jgi:hypothetical protein
LYIQLLQPISRNKKIALNPQKNLTKKICEKL